VTRKAAPSRAALAITLGWAAFALACASTTPNPAPEATAEMPEATAEIPEATAEVPEAAEDLATEPTPAAPVVSSADAKRFRDALEYSHAHSGRVLLVIQGNRVVLAAARAGSDPHRPHSLENASESFWGVVAAAAAEDGLLDLDEKVSDTLPSFAGDRWGREMRVRHLLHYTSGLESGAIRRAGAPDGRVLLALEMVSPPGDRFQYGPSHLRVFTEVLRRKLEAQGRDPDPVRYLEERILAPVGASVSAWERDTNGAADPSGGASLTAYDWARFGMLLRGKGSAASKRVLAPEPFDAILAGSSVNPGFGHALWLNPARPDNGAVSSWSVRNPVRSFYPGGLPDLSVAAGAGNQRLYVIPSLDLVVVRFGQEDRRFRDEELLRRLVQGATQPTS